MRALCDEQRLEDELKNVEDVFLLYEYRDLFIDMDVRNNRSELATANGHQERWNFTRWKIIVYGLWLADHERATPARRLV